MGRRAGILIILLFMACSGAFYAWKHAAQPPGMIRLHVVANSNAFYDQELKYRVKDRIVSETATAFNRAGDAGEARAIADAEATRIESIAREEIRRQGFDYPVRVERGTYHFPVKTYTARYEGAANRLTLPPGRYEAVRVVIGSGRGANWWCVLYPPLCFVDSGQALPPAGIPAATAVEKHLSSNGQEKYEKPRVEYRFRTAELWNKLFRKQ